MQGATVAAMLLDEHFSAFEAGWAAIVGEVEQYGGAQVRAVLSAAFDTCFSPCSAYVRASSGATAVALQLHNNMTEDLAAALGDCTEIGRSAAAAAHAADAAFSAAAVDLDDGRRRRVAPRPLVAFNGHREGNGHHHGNGNGNGNGHHHGNGNGNGKVSAKANGLSG